MEYLSTRNGDLRFSSAYVIAQGISEEGGLFVPENIPVLSAEDFGALCSMKYIDRAAFILKRFLTDFSDEEIRYCVNGAYAGTFDNDDPAPLFNLNENVGILELWHGPTCAFKDLALQILPYFVTTAEKKISGGKKIVILVATSGDTGKAALEGFKDVPNTDIIVFYPSEGVSATQKLQMASQEGSNVHVFGIKGNFDDAQSGVKKIFTDTSVIKKLAENKMAFSSANSINWGRLAPQIVYYISAYCDMLNSGKDLSGGFNVTVPTGNFGNILAAYIAMAMGTPINKLICASNSNNVLTDFINTGIYDKNRSFYTTISPSMDILISSNLERMLYFLSGDTNYVKLLEDSLSGSGKFEVNDCLKSKMQELFYGNCCTDEETIDTIAETYKKYGYLCDTHTAVAVGVYNKYVNDTGDLRPAVIASTASPYKFSKNVLSAVSKDVPEDEFYAIDALHNVTNTSVPTPIAQLRNKKIRFSSVIDKTELKNAVFKTLGL
ncbi:MAG: threonine synthase [Clostridia bacterium]|nr:threonine synthase [Clostridia bacterium]